MFKDVDLQLQEAPEPTHQLSAVSQDDEKLLVHVVLQVAGPVRQLARPPLEDRLLKCIAH